MQISLKTGLKALLVSSLALASSFSHAANELRWFDIEVLIFKRNIDVSTSNEYWPQPQQLSISPSQALLAPLFDCGSEDCIAPRFDQLPVQINGRGWPVSGPTHRRMLSSQQLELKPQFNKLKQHAGFTPLIHLGWREVVAPRNRAAHYQIQAGLDYSSDFNQFGLPHGLEPAPLAANDRAEESNTESANQDDLFAQFEQQDTPLDKMDSGFSTPQAIWELEGGIKVYLQHYLYIESQLLLKQPVEVEVAQQIQQQPEPELAAVLDTELSSQLDSVGTAPAVLLGDEDANNSPSLIRKLETRQELNSYLFDQKRRVRSGEIHYFDHPLMGMIIQIRRGPENKKATPAPATEEAQSTEATSPSVDAT